MFKSASILVTISVSAFLFWGWSSHAAEEKAIADPLPAKVEEKLPTAKEVLERFAREIGGKEAFARHKSQHAKGTVQMPGQGIKGTMDVYAARPNKLLMKMNMEGIGEFVSGYNGEVGWMSSAVTGPMVLEGRMLEQVATQADFDHALHDPADYKSMELLGKETFEGEMCYKLKLVHRTGFHSTEFFSVKTGLQVGFITTEESPLGPVTATSVVKDYKKFGDLRMPSQVVQKMSGMETILTINEMEFDQVDPAVFETPVAIKALIEKKE